jgi:PilZ domain
MSKDRRMAPRKAYMMSVQVRVRTEVFAPAPDHRAHARGEQIAATLDPGLRLGETINISELGIYFKSHERIAFGEELEMSFRLPGELTGRGPEKVRCSARVVHVNASIDGKPTSGIGVAIGRFASDCEASPVIRSESRNARRCKG